MKQYIIATAMALALGSAASASAQAAAGGTITFNGAVTDMTCTVSGGSGTNGGTGNFIVSLDPVPSSALPAAGAIAGPKPFDVVIGGPGQGSCTNGKIAAMSFLPSSPQVDPTTGTLKNALAGEAGNTNIELVDETASAVINLADPSNSFVAPAIADNTAVIPFSAHYKAVGGAATPGLVSTSVVYAVRYN